ncbi:MAG TPA: 4Fe-4S binding protein [bacterium]|nr:4Fe-4S binding protein [bacterium]HOL50385.1 4Fe-4S binding protein [bacterium]HPO51964.1 4Fe-4S binding protein [bacterium]
MGKRFSVKINKNRCKGCGLCIEVCSQKNLIISKLFNKFGCHFVEVIDNTNCNGCKKCAIICPDAAIEIFYEEETPKENTNNREDK